MSIFSKLRLAIPTWLSTQRLKSASSQRAGLYLRCSQLPFHNFLQCLIDGDLSALIIRGKHSEGVLAEVWTNIYYEYISLSDIPEAKYFVLLQRDITLLQDEIFTVETNLYLLSPVMIPFSIDYRNELVDQINQFGYKLKIDFTADYSNSIQAIEFKLAPRKQKLANKEKEFKEYLLSKVDQTIDRQYFTKILNRLSKYQGYPIRPKEISVTEYVSLLKDYVSYIESQQKEMEETTHG